MAKKILYIHQDGSVTGSAISLRNLIAALDRNRFLPQVLLAAEGHARRLFESLDVQVDMVAMPLFATAPGPRWYQPSAWGQYRAILPNRELENFLREADPDIIHINDKAALAAGLTARKVGKPVVQHLRSSYANTRLTWNARVSRMGIRRYSDHLISISEDETDGFHDLDHLSVIYNSVDLSEADRANGFRNEIRADLGLSDNCLAISMIGNLSEQKGAWDFIRAAGRAARQISGVKFIIIAPIPEKNSWNLGISGRLGLKHAQYPFDRAIRIANESEVLDKLIFAGHRQDILNVMAAMDIVVACFRLPAIGRPALEAMSVGKPVITNRGHSGRSKVVIDKVTGFTLPGGDVSALAQAMICLAQAPDLRNKMGQNGWEYARQHFDPRKNARAVMNIYDKVLQEGRYA